MNRSLPSSPLARGLMVGGLLGAATLALGWGVRGWSAPARQGDAESGAAELAQSAADLTGDWLTSCQETNRLLALQAAGHAPGLEGVKVLLRAALDAHPNSLRAAVVVGGDGEVVAAASGWREGTRPSWVPALHDPPAVGWRPTDDGGWFVAREPLSPSALSLHLLTAWDPAELMRRMGVLLESRPGAGLSLVSPAGVALQVAPGTSPAGAAVLREVVGTDLTVQATLPDPAAGLPWLMLAAVAAGVAGGVGAGWLQWRHLRLMVQVKEAAARAGSGEVAAPASLLLRHLPEVGEALEELGRRAAAQGQHERAVLDALERMRGAAVLVSDAAGTVEFAGGDVAEILGRPAADLVGSSLRRVFAGGAWEVLTPALKSCHSGSLSRTVYIESGRSSDDPGRLEVTLNARDKGAGHILVVQPEVARSPRPRQGPDEGTEHRRLLELLGEGMALLRDGVVEMANPALGTLLGLSPDELVGSAFKHYVAPEDVLHLVHALRDLPEQGKRVEVRLRRADSLSCVEASIAAIPVQGEDTCLLVVTDRTESRRSERRLLEAHSRLDATLDATSDGVLAVKMVGSSPSIIVANRSFAEMFGMEVESLLDRSEQDVFRQLIDTGRLPEGFGTWARDLGRQTGKRRTGRFEVNAGGQRKVLEVQATPLFLPDGEEPGRVIAFRDITAQSQVERRLREDQEAAQARGREMEGANRELEQLNRQLQQRAGELDQANTALKEIDEKRSRVLAEVTHELQTPLVSIRGFTEMILRKKVGPVTPDQERGLQISLKNIDRLISLIDNLLEFIRAEGDLPELRRSNFRLDELVGDVFDTLRPAAEKRSINLKAAYDGGRPVVRADRGQIHQALTNLVNNAIKFSPENREVVVEVVPNARGFAQLIVRDSGPGIPADHLLRIFDRGYRVPGATAEGSGLGLYITHQILSQHGCSIKASSPEGGGALFRLTLPLAREGKPLGPSRSVPRSDPG